MAGSSALRASVAAPRMVHNSAAAPEMAARSEAPAPVVVPPVQSPAPTHGIHVATLQLKAHSQKTFELDFFADFAVRAAHAMKMPTGGIAQLPIQTSLWTVPRGPFVHKKSQENFWRRTHRRSIKVYDASDATVDRWLQFLRHHEMPGVASKAQLFRRYPLSVGQQLADSLPADASQQHVKELAEDILRMHANEEA